MTSYLDLLDLPIFQSSGTTTIMSLRDSITVDPKLVRQQGYFGLKYLSFEDIGL